MATPTVLEVARTYFDCSTLTGLELENGEGNCGVLGTQARDVGPSAVVCNSFLPHPLAVRVDSPPLHGTLTGAHAYASALCPLRMAGSHWESRLMRTDIMAPVVTSGTPNISPMTLALFEDSGVYDPMMDCGLS
jgi:hypothetical protein